MKTGKAKTREFALGATKVEHADFLITDKAIVDYEKGTIQIVKRKKPLKCRVTIAPAKSRMELRKHLARLLAKGLKKSRVWTVVTLCALCASSSFAEPPLPQGTEWIAWTGPQEIVIGTSQRSDLKSFAVPVYFGNPVRSYRIIGMIVEHGATKAEEEGRSAVVQSLAASAKAHGAEAILIQPLTSEIREVVQARYPGESFYAFAIAIRWRRPNDS